MEYKDFLKYIEKLFDFYEKNDVETNETTGFHINISFKDKAKMQGIDTVKLMLFMGEDYIKKMFARLKKTSDDNLMSRVGPLIDRIQQDHLANTSRKEWDKSEDDLPTMNISQNIELFIRQLNVALNRQRNDSGRVVIRGWEGNGGAKSFTVALHRLATKGYVEFRLVGGKNYHKRFDDIQSMVNRFVRVLHVASDKNAYKKEYKKIGNLISTSRVIEPKGTENEIEIILKDHPLLLQSFYHIEHGHTDKHNPEFSHVEKTSEDIGWRLIDFIERSYNVYSLEMNKPAIRRAIHVLRKKYDVTNELLVDLISKKMQWDSFDVKCQDSCTLSWHSFTKGEKEKTKL